MSTSMTAQLVADALTMALWRRGKRDALLHHSDQGSQYTSEPFQRLLTENGDLQHEPVGQRLGQRGDGELLLIAEDGAHGAADIPDARRGPRPTYSITSSASTIRSDGTRRWDISARWSSKCGHNQLSMASTKPGEGQALDAGIAIDLIDFRP